MFSGNDLFLESESLKICSSVSSNAQWRKIFGIIRKTEMYLLFCIRKSNVFLLLFTKFKPRWCKNVLRWFEILMIADSLTQTPYLN